MKDEEKTKEQSNMSQGKERVQKDIIILLISAVFMYIVASLFDIYEIVTEFVKRHEQWNVDELIIVFLVLGVSVMTLSIRRVKELQHEVTVRKKMESKLQTLSVTDELTGLHNRRGFFTLTEYLLKAAKRQKLGIFLLYVDMDNLKDINDRLGHNEGDNALIDVANILKTNYRDSDVIARIGGDEFVVVPVGTTGDNVELITTRLQKQLDIHNETSNRSYKLSLSRGIVYYDPEQPRSIDELLTEADKFMYAHKRHKQES